LIFVSLSSLKELNYHGGTAIYHGDVYINRFGSGTITFGYAGAHDFYGNLYFNGTQATSDGNNNHFNFKGNTNQSIASTNTHQLGFLRLGVNKPGGALSIDAKVNVLVNLSLTKGNIQVQPTANFGLSTSATVSGGSDSSYVEGFMSKQGTAAFTFPTGRNGHYKPIIITAPAANSTFKARYANLDPSEEHALTNKDSTLNEIGTNEYWILERTAGTSNVSVTLSRDNMGCSYADINDIKITAFNGTTWKDLGQGNVTGSDSSGTITTNGASSVYGMYTLATSDTFDCVPCRADAGEDKVVLQYMSTYIGNELNSTSSDLAILINWTPITGVFKPERILTRCSAINTNEYKILITNLIGCKSEDRMTLITTPRNLTYDQYNCINAN
jgi:hypothetical protein